MSNKVVHVAAGVIINSRGKVLIAKRAEDVHQGGLWEFPGGKLEPGEDTKDALRRELHEELGIDILSAHPLIRIHHDYPDKSILLDVWKITTYTGEAHGKEGQPVKWLSPGELNKFDFPEANRAIIKAAQLPDRYMITGEYETLNKAKKHIQKRIQQGISLVQFRAKYLSDNEYRIWAKALITICRESGAILLLNKPAQDIAGIEPDGIHLSSGNLMGCVSRPLEKEKLLSASVHNEAELEKAMTIGVDFVVIAPVLKTQTHPEAEPMGWDKFYSLTEKATCPVYALGGMTDDQLEQAQQYGAQGIAAIRGLS